MSIEKRWEGPHRQLDTNKTRKGKLSQKKVRTILIPSNLSQCDGSWPVATASDVWDRIAGCKNS